MSDTVFLNESSWSEFRTSNILYVISSSHKLNKREKLKHIFKCSIWSAVWFVLDITLKSSEQEELSVIASNTINRFNYITDFLTLSYDVTLS